MSLPPGPWLRSQLIFTPPKPTRKYTGQTVLVTGSNVGLGLEAARWFVKLDAAKVILAVRDLDKGEQAKKSIEQSEHRTGVVEVWHLDLSSYESVKACAKRAEVELERLDVLVENAGIVTYRFKLTEENESTITTNVVSPLLHAVLSLPKMRETAVRFNTTPRLVFTASFVHYLARFPERSEERIFDALTVEEKTDLSQRYYLSKLLQMYAIRELASLTQASPKPGKIIINCLNPGWVVTNVMREYRGLQLFLFKIGCLVFARSTEVGSRTIVNAAEGGEETHGEYLDDCRVARTAPLISGAEGEGLQRRVWGELAEVFERIEPGILGSI